jgi:membrane protein implicated in regulation of membrane protease activity
VVDGERWKVRAAQPLRDGGRVRVARVDGLTLEVTLEVSPTAPATQGVSR